MNALLVHVRERHRRAGECSSAAPWAADGASVELIVISHQSFFSFAQEPIEIDGLVKILSGLKPNRIHEPRGREVCP
jgi:hypothetical protein